MHIYVDVDRPQWAGPVHAKSVHNLTHALVAKWEQIPAAKVHNLVESLRVEEWRLLWQQIRVSPYFWPHRLAIYELSWMRGEWDASQQTTDLKEKGSVDWEAAVNWFVYVCVRAWVFEN